MFNRPDLNLSVTTNGDYNLSLSIAYLIMHVEKMRCINSKYSNKDSPFFYNNLKITTYS